MLFIQLQHVSKTILGIGYLSVCFYINFSITAFLLLVLPCLTRITRKRLEFPLIETVAAAAAAA